MPRNGRDSASMNFGWVRVVVRNLDPSGAVAVCMDNKGASYTVRTDLLPSRCSAPRPGEQWLLTQPYGDWVFTHVFTTPVDLSASLAVLRAQADPAVADPSQADLNAALATVLLALSDR